MKNYSAIINQFRNAIQAWQGAPISTEGFYQQDVKNVFVFNKDARTLDPDEVKFILVGDNPGREEQIQERYLIGQSGKIARNFFTNQLGIEFSRHVLVLNKTPIYTDKTGDLPGLPAMLQATLIDTQIYMAKLTYQLQKTIGCPVFVTGFSGCRATDGTWLKYGTNGYPKSMLLPYYFSTLRELCADENFAKNIFLFKHFSHGNFTKDFKLYSQKTYKDRDIETLALLYKIGQTYRLELLR